MKTLNDHTRRPVEKAVKAGLAGAAATMLLLGSGTSLATAAVRGCPQTPSTSTQGRLGQFASILSVRSMSCRGAVGFVRRYGVGVRTGGEGSTFQLGPFRCSVYHVNFEDNNARCTSGTHAFRVDYGD